MVAQVIQLEELSKWDFRYFSLACQVAQWSKDPRKKVGAVLTGKDKRNVSLGYNGLPPGMDDKEYMRWDNKNWFILHAERNVLDKTHFDVLDSTLYISQPVCCQCAASLISRGVKTVVQPQLSEGSSWYSNCYAAISFMDDADLQVFSVARIDPDDLT